MNCPHCGEHFHRTQPIPDQPDPNLVEYVHLRGYDEHVQVRVCPPRVLGKAVPANDTSWIPDYEEMVAEAEAEGAPLTTEELKKLGVEEA